jgi:hypothetical protein
LTNCILTGNWAGRDGGGAFQARLDHCVLSKNVAGDDGGGARDCTVLSSVLASNAASARGGAGHRCTLYSSVVTNNVGMIGGGLNECVLYDCVVAGNVAQGDGGGCHGSTLDSCLLSRNSGHRGGGAYNSTLYSCRVIENTVPHDGGGVDECTLYNCLLTGNYAGDDGGGADDSLLYNCTLAGNSSRNRGGGGDESTLYNCIAYYNTAAYYPNHYKCYLSYCCTTPWASGGGGVITNEPAFVNAASGNYQLRPESPCIDAGRETAPLPGTDLAGAPRLLDGNGDGGRALDLGAYEFDLRSVVPPDWLIAHGLNPADPYVLEGDPDVDAFNTYREWTADTDPTNAVSVLRIESISMGPPVTVQFHGATTRLYSLLANTNLAQGVWSPLPGQVDLSGTGAWQSLIDTNPGPQRYYRVGVRVP